MTDLTRAEMEKYMINDLDRGWPFAPAYHPPTSIHENCKVTPLIDGNAYFTDLMDEIGNLAFDTDPTDIRGIYISGWHIKKDFEFASIKLIDLLEEKATAGFDVKVMLWLNDYLLNPFRLSITPTPVPTLHISDIVPFGNEQADNMEFIDLVRSKNNPKLEAIANYLDHDLGSAHIKQVIIFANNKIIVYTGGIDFVNDRAASQQHNYDNWHDIQLKVEGSVTQEIYQNFINFWNEIVKKTWAPFFWYKGKEIQAKLPVYSEITNVKNFTFSPTIGNIYCQSLITFPKNTFNLETNLIGTKMSKLGTFQIELSLRTAIKNAQEYIYVEDQWLFSRYLYNLLKLALKDRPNLKIIFFIGLIDPYTPKTDLLPSTFEVMSKYLLSDLTSTEIQRIVLFVHSQAIIHSKVWLIDDKWALVGSSNMENRSLFIDIEHCIAFMDKTNNLVKKFRIELWGEHFGLSPSGEERFNILDNIDKSLHLWNPSWDPTNSNRKLPMYIDNISEIIDSSWSFPEHDGNQLFFKILGEINIYGGDFDKIIIPNISSTNPEYVNVLYKFFIKIENGPNAGCVRKIGNVVLNTDGTITLWFMPMTNQNISGTQFSLYLSRITKIDLFSIRDNFNLSSWQEYILENIRDPGELP